METTIRKAVLVLQKALIVEASLFDRCWHFGGRRTGQMYDSTQLAMIFPLRVRVNMVDIGYLTLRRPKRADTLFREIPIQRAVPMIEGSPPTWPSIVSAAGFHLAPIAGEPVLLELK